MRVEICPGADVSCRRPEDPRPMGAAQNDRVPRLSVVRGSSQGGRSRPLVEDTSNHIFSDVRNVDQAHYGGGHVGWKRKDPGPQRGAEAAAPIGGDRYADRPALQ